ncbi:MAG: hypothetical protein K2W93_13605 [Burkholderiaceae bacterium]|nr:hypothetical protein [Burkholderiaceae bacterium]
MIRALSLAFLLTPAVATASFLIPMKLTCPIGGHEFEATGGGVGSVIDHMLDGMPIGASLDQWPICPDNGFVMFYPEPSPEQLKVLKAYIQTREYQDVWRASSNSHLLAAMLMQKLGLPPRVVAKSFLQAAWEERDADRYRSALQRALQNFNSSFSKPSELSAEWFSDQLIAGDLERRLGYLQNAGKRFEQLRNSAFKKTFRDQKVIDYQLQLIANQDRLSRKLSEALNQ